MVRKACLKNSVRFFTLLLPALLFVSIGPSAIAVAQQPSPEDLTFGFFMVRSDEHLELLPPANTGWARMAGVAAWGGVELEPGSGVYNFTMPDPIIQEANDLGIQLLLNLNQVHPLDAGANAKALPTDLPAYRNFVQAFVERYDGDGIDDAPTSSVVRYWQIGNEPDSPTEWTDTPENFALFVKESAEAIHLADPTAVVLIGGLARGLVGLQDFYDTVFTTLDGYGGAPYFDVFDVHWFATAMNNNYMGLDNVVVEIKNLFAAHGYGDLPIWVTETATYSDTPDGWDPQTEDDHARDLARRLLHYRSLGMEKVFWTPLKEFHDWKGVPNHYFDNTGLINNPLNDGNADEKKAYYTYLLLASKLDGALVQTDSLFMQRLAESVAKGGEFANYGKTYYAIWVDDPIYEGSLLSFPTDYDTFTVYHLVPDENNEILSEVVESVGGNFEYPLSVNPILVEYSGLDITYPIRGSALNTPTIAVEGVVEIDPEVVFENPPSGSPINVFGSEPNGEFAFSEETFPEGPNTIHLTAQDALGNVSEVSLDFVIDTQAPTITDITEWPDTLEENAPYGVKATIIDADKVVDPVLVYTINGTDTYEAPMELKNNNRWRGEIPRQPVGTEISYYVKAGDAAGNQATGPSALNPLTFDILASVSAWLAPVNTGLCREASLEVDANVYNFGPYDRTYNVKIIVTLPDARELLMNDVNLLFGAGEHKSQRLTHLIPPKAPLGTYTYSLIVSGPAGKEYVRSAFAFTIHY